MNIQNLKFKDKEMETETVWLEFPLTKIRILQINPNTVQVSVYDKIDVGELSLKTTEFFDVC